MLESPFGTTISAQQVIETLQPMRSWEDKYRQVIQWGKQLPSLPVELQQRQVLVSGCESQVWLICQAPLKTGGIWTLIADSDARIVRGLIAIVLAALNHKTSEQLLSFDVQDYFQKLGLVEHLSPSRGNGLYAIVEQIYTAVKAN